MAKTQTDETRYPDVWSEALHASRYYRALTVFLGLILLILTVILWGQVSRPLPDPLVVRVDEVGRAEVIDYTLGRATADPGDPVVPFFLRSFVYNHFERRHGLGAEPWELSHYFLTAELSQAAYLRDEESLVSFISSGGLVPEIMLENFSLRLIPQPDPPYRAEVFFDRVEWFNGQEISRRSYTASLRFVFADDVPQETLFRNPLGLVVTYLEVQEELSGPAGP